MGAAVSSDRSDSIEGRRAKEPAAPRDRVSGTYVVLFVGSSALDPAERRAKKQGAGLGGRINLRPWREPMGWRRPMRVFFFSGVTDISSTTAK